MPVARINEILGHDVAAHLQPGDKRVELTTHLGQGKPARLAQVTRHQATLLTQCLENHSLDATFLRRGETSPSPITEIRPPFLADEPGLAVEELAVGASAILQDLALPSPQRPLPAAIR